MKAKVEIVYLERWIDPETRHEDDPNSVFVEIRRYGCTRRHSTGDVIMQCAVINDAEAIVFEKVVLEDYMSSAELQRIGIAKFDQLKADHPALAKAPNPATGAWSRAPEWAQWWAQDASGHAYWYETKPHLNTVYNYWVAQAAGQFIYDDGEYLADGGTVHADWTQSLVQRQEDRNK